MRDKQRIKRILMKVEEIWENDPDLRLTQLIINTVQPKDPCPQVYNYEDDLLERRLEEFINKYVQKRNYADEKSSFPNPDLTKNNR